MKRLFLILIIALLNTGQLSAQATFESAEISFLFVSKDVDGTIGGFESDSEIHLDDLTNSRINGSVAVESLKTGIFLRDWSLKSGKYFDEDEFPRISFESTSVVERDNGFKVSGKLTIKGTSKNIAVDFVRNGNQMTGKITLYSSDYGINIKSKREDNLVEVELVLNLRP
ncbi:MAG: YceI family protein [Flavobacteriaceae bacterium]